MNANTRLGAALALALFLALQPALAGPGAHGPNGEHLDAPTAAAAGPALPRVEAHTEAFELVAELRASELVVLVDRYETNEPVLGAKLEVESNGLKAVASFRAEQGDYAVTDGALLKALAAPGEHGLVFTLVAGAAGDLLDGTLVVTASNAAQAHNGSDHAHDHAPGRTAWVGGGIAVLGLLGGIVWWRQRRAGTFRTGGAL
jgi:hypothetical protein